MRQRFGSFHSRNAGQREADRSRDFHCQTDFEGDSRLPVDEQKQIAASIQRRTYRLPLDAATEQALERLRAEWQNSGYFKVQVSGEAKTLTSSPANEHVALTVRLTEGLRYRLGSVTFHGNKAITNGEMLRKLFPIAHGDVFSREKVGKVLESLRKEYGWSRHLGRGRDNAPATRARLSDNAGKHITDDFLNRSS